MKVIKWTQRDKKTGKNEVALHSQLSCIPNRQKEKTL